MKIFNPNYQDPVVLRAAELATQIEAYFTANPGVAAVSADALRAALPAVAAELTEGMLSQICQGKGWTIGQ